MNDILKGNYKLKKIIEEEKPNKPIKNDYRRKAINSIGGSMVYVERTPLKWDGNEKKLDKLLELVEKQQTNQQTSQQWVAEDLGSISSSVEAVPEPHVSDSVKSALLGIPINSGRGESPTDDRKIY